MINIYAETEDVALQVDVLQAGLFSNLPIVLYCESLKCDDSKVLYRQITDTFGEFENLHIYADGWFGLLEANVATTSAPQLDDTAAIADLCLNAFLANGGLLDPALTGDPNGSGRDHSDPNVILEADDG